jgi:hypothetical protein
VNASASLFDDVVAASGLLSLIAPFTVSRLLIAAGVTPQALTRADLARALPDLEKGLGVYLDEDQLAEARSRLSRLAAE